MDETSGGPFSQALDQRVSLQNFELIRVLGKGAYGKVFLVRKVGGNDHGNIYAMKVLRKTRVMQKAKTLEHTLTERTVLEQIRKAPFLVNLQYAFQTDNKLHLVMDYVSGGELFTHLCTSGHLSLDTTTFLIAELAVALDNLHKVGIIYRDLKLENVMLDDEGHIILTDFGLSKAFGEEDLDRTTDSYCGTIEYMAPEIVQRKEKYDESVDWWSLGVLTFELLTGCSPFTVEGSKNSSREIAERICAKKVPFPRSFPIIARDFASKLMTKEPPKRLGFKTSDEIFSHPFFKSIDWDALRAKKLPPPLKPAIRHKLDVHNFADEFTKQQPVYTPGDAPDCPINSGGTRQLFRGYSYISPSVMFGTDNAISADYVHCGAQPPQIDVQKLGEDQNSTFFRKYNLDMTGEGFLGRGTFSICRKCRKKDNGSEFAVKIISRRFHVQAQREAQILRQCQQHPNIVKMYEVLQDTLHIYIVLELLRGPELLGRIKRIHHFTEKQAAKFMRRLVSVVRYLHKEGIVHRDLKPENILFESDDPNAELRLVDFGFARQISSSDKPMQTPCFTLHYAAPEVLLKDPESSESDWLPTYNQQCDLWSLGVILYTMLSGRVPFHAATEFESAGDIMKRIRNAEFSFNAPEWAIISEEAKDVISGLLTVDPEERLTLTELVNDPWFNDERATPDTPLSTPSVLADSASRAFNQTLNAFLCASKEGFHLADVSAAPLAQRRRRKRRSDDSGYLTAPNSDSMEISTKQDSESSNEGKRKRKLLPVVTEQSVEGEEDCVLDDSKIGKTVPRPTSLEFSIFREAPGSGRHTNDTSIDAPPPPQTQHRRSTE